jgi:diguanylate cyclase (GGDEF)-like protein
MTEQHVGEHGQLSTLDSADGGRELELQRAIGSVLSAIDLRGSAVDEALQDLEVPFGDEVYSELFHIMCHLRFEPVEAKRLWSEVLGHRGVMQGRLGSPLDLRVAMLSYLVEIRRKLADPKIIERVEFERTQESAYTDHLTGLRNYRYFAEQLNHEVLRSDQYSEPLSLVMIDIDHFKAFNDRNGHEAGNEILRRVGAIVRARLRKVDVGARYGGEEFAVILPSTPKRGAHTAAERLRAAIEAHDFPGAEGQPLGRLTASLGVATYPAEGRNAAEFVECCDRALYHAKAEGRNRVGFLGGMRSYPRINVEIEGRCSTPDEQIPLRTIQIGTNGMSFRTTSRVEPGVLVEVEIDLPERTPGIRFSGRVLRVSPVRDGWNDVAVLFLEMAPEDRRLLAKFVRSLLAA